MGVPFRQRGIAEYLKLVWRRKWFILLPALAVAAAVALVVRKLPDVYESHTLIVVKPSTIDANLLQMGDSAVANQLNQINQVVTSRNSLEPLIKKYNLFQEERARNVPMELLIEQMQGNITVDTSTDSREQVNAFRITFKGRDPRTTQGVTAELAAKYIEAQSTIDQNNSVGTKTFFDNQMKEAQAELERINAQREQYLAQNINSLPTQLQSMVQQLTSLRDSQRSLLNEIGRLKDRRSTYAAQLGDLDKVREYEVSRIMDNGQKPKETQAYAELIKKRAELLAQLKQLRATYREKHPDVIAKQDEIEANQREIDNLVKDGEDRAKEQQRRLKEQPDPRSITIQNEINLADGEIARQQALVADNERQIAQMQERISRVPTAEVNIAAIDRNYAAAKANYDSMLEKYQKANLQTEAKSNAQGATIQVVDPANLPSYPIAPKRYVLMGMGVMGGLFIGLLLAALIEIPRFFTIQTMDDAEFYTGLPVLLAMPAVVTPREERRNWLKQTAFVVGGFVAAVVSVPLLARLIDMTHILERFVK